MKKQYLNNLIVLTLNLSMLLFISCQMFTTVYAESGSSDDVFADLFEIANVLAGVGVGLCMIKLVQIGYKFMFKPANKRSDAMQSLYPWAIGCFICALWFPLGQWVMGLFGITVSDEGKVDTGFWGGPFDI